MGQYWEFVVAQLRENQTVKWHGFRGKFQKQCEQAGDISILEFLFRYLETFGPAYVAFLGDSNHDNVWKDKCVASDWDERKFAFGRYERPEITKSTFAGGPKNVSIGLVNHTLKEYLTFSSWGSVDDESVENMAHMGMLALLLLSHSSGRGGGDIRGFTKMPWAGCLLSIERTPHLMSPAHPLAGFRNVTDVHIYFTLLPAAGIGAQIPSATFSEDEDYAMRLVDVEKLWTIVMARSRALSKVHAVVDCGDHLLSWMIASAPLWVLIKLRDMLT